MRGHMLYMTRLPDPFITLPCCAVRAQVDQDLNGTLSSEEWEQFLRQMSHKVPSVLGRKLFLTLDRDRDGKRIM